MTNPFSQFAPSMRVFVCSHRNQSGVQFNLGGGVDGHAEQGDERHNAGRNGFSDSPVDSVDGLRLLRFLAVSKPEETAKQRRSEEISPAQNFPNPSFAIIAVLSIAFWTLVAVWIFRAANS